VIQLKNCSLCSLLIINCFALQILFILGPGSLALLFTVMGYGYQKLDGEETSRFLKHFYKLDFKGFIDPSESHNV
jgi:hypothetical protein